MTLRSRRLRKGITFGTDLGNTGIGFASSSAYPNALFLNGVPGNYASTPDDASLDITGDIDIRCAVAMDDWTPSASLALLGKWTAAGSQRSYQLLIQSSGIPQFNWTTDGTSGTSAGLNASAAPTVSDRGLLLLRVTLDVDNGSAQKEAKYYTKQTVVGAAFGDALGDSGWTQLGTTATAAGVASIFSGAGVLEVGSLSTGMASLIPGRVLAAVVKNGIDGTTVFAADFTKQPPGTKSFTEQTGKVVTVQGSAFIDRYETGGTLRSLRLPGSSGNYASTPDAAALDITDNIDLRAGFAFDDWTPSAIATILAKEQTTSTRSYRWSVATSGALVLTLSNDGSATAAATSSVIVGATDLSAIAVRVTWRNSDGRVQFFTKAATAATAAAAIASDSGWTQLGTDQTISTVTIPSIFSGTSQLEVGSRIAGTSEVATGRCLAAEIRNNVLADGTGVVFRANFNRPIGEASFTCETGQVVTLQGNARYAYEAS